MLTIVGGCFRIYIELTAGPTGNPFIDAWAIWDAGWYLEIATNGYANEVTGRGQASYAFFPLFPYLIQFVGLVIPHQVFAALLISNMSLIAAAVALYRWVEIDYGEERANAALVTFFVFPTSFILGAVMSESLFLVCALLCLYMARKNRFGWAGFWGLLAVLTRSMGLFLVIPLAYEIYQQHKKLHAHFLWLLMLPLGLGIFGLMVYQITGDPLAFLTIQKAWLRETTNPLSVLIQGLVTTEENAFVFNAALSIIIGLLLVFSYRQLRRGDYLLCIALFFFPLSAGIVSLYSMMRFTAVIFPLFLIVSLFIGKYPRLKAPALGVGIFVQFLFMVLWTTGSYYII